MGGPNAVKILDTLEKTPKLARMERSLQEKSSQSVVYEQLLDEEAEPGARGRYIHDPQGGHIIKLRVDGLIEYTVAHELAHGLMKADGYVSAGFWEQDEILQRTVRLIRETVLHPAMSHYLVSFGYLESQKATYDKQVDYWLDHRQQITQRDNSFGWNPAFMALQFVEALLAVPECKVRLGKIMKTKAPNIWRITQRWHRRLKRFELTSPLSCRIATVALMKELDSYASTTDSHESLFDRIIVPVILRKSEKRSPALSVFRLDIRKMEGVHLGLLRYLRDGSVVLPLDPEEFGETPRTQWPTITASELLVRVEDTGSLLFFPSSSKNGNQSVS